jgi:integrase
MKRKNLMERYDQCPQFARHLENQKDAESVMSDAEKQLIYTALQERSELAAKFFKVLIGTGLRINEGLGLSFDNLFKGKTNNKSLDAQLDKESINYYATWFWRVSPRADRYYEMNMASLVVNRSRVKKSSRRKTAGRSRFWIKKRLMLAELWIIQKERLNKKVHGSDPKNYLLFDGLTKNTFGNYMRSVCSRHKIRPYTPHCCRHTFATEFTGMIMGNIFLCQLVLGHADTSTTRKYIHLWEQIQKDLKSADQLREGISLIE